MVSCGIYMNIEFELVIIVKALSLSTVLYKNQYGLKTRNCRLVLILKTGEIFRLENRPVLFLYVVSFLLLLLTYFFTIAKLTLIISKIREVKPNFLAHGQSCLRDHMFAFQ